MTETKQRYITVRIRADRLDAVLSSYDFHMTRLKRLGYEIEGLVPQLFKELRYYSNRSKPVEKTDEKKDSEHPKGYGHGI